MLGPLKKLDPEASNAGIGLSADPLWPVCKLTSLEVHLLSGIMHVVCFGVQSSVQSHGCGDAFTSVERG